MTELGVFAVDRGVFTHPLFADGNPLSRREAWLWLLSEAAWKSRGRDIGGQIVPLQRGQLAHSVRFMGEAWGWPKSKVARFLDRLKTETMIGTETGTGFTVITICNYDAYQRVSLPDRDSKRDTDRDSSGTAAGQTKDIQNIQSIPLPPAGAKRRRKVDDGYGDERDPLYADFLSEVWAKRWKREGHNRFKAFGIYARLSEADRSDLKSNIERCARAIVSERSEVKFRPMLQSWLNGRGWEVDAAANSAAAAAAVDWPGRVKYFRESGEWPPAWGPRPGDPDCKVPGKLLIAPAA